MQARSERNWWQRNWPWVVPAGLLLLALLAAAGYGAVSLLTGMMRSNDVYRVAMERVHQHPAASKRLGEPIEAGFFVQGSINVTTDRGDADLRIPVTGARAEGTIRAVAHRVRGSAGWTLDEMQLEVGSEAPIELRTAEEIQQAEEAR